MFVLSNAKLQVAWFSSYFEFHISSDIRSTSGPTCPSHHLPNAKKKRNKNKKTGEFAFKSEFGRPIWMRIILFFFCFSKIDTTSVDGFFPLLNPDHNFRHNKHANCDFVNFHFASCPIVSFTVSDPVEPHKSNRFFLLLLSFLCHDHASFEACGLHCSRRRPSPAYLTSLH